MMISRNDFGARGIENVLWKIIFTPPPRFGIAWVMLSNAVIVGSGSFSFVLEGAQINLLPLGRRQCYLPRALLL